MQDQRAHGGSLACRLGPAERIATPYPDHLRDLVEAYLENLDFAATDPIERAEMTGTEGLVEAMRYSLLAGGKRMRPVLALATAEASASSPRRSCRRPRPSSWCTPTR